MAQTYPDTSFALMHARLIDAIAGKHILVPCTELQFAKATLGRRKGASYEEMVRNMEHIVKVTVQVPSLGNGQETVRALAGSVEDFGVSLVRAVKNIASHKELHEALAARGIRKISVTVLKQMRGSKIVSKNATALVPEVQKKQQKAATKKKRAA